MELMKSAAYTPSPLSILFFRSPRVHRFALTIAFVDYSFINESTKATVTTTIKVNGEERENSRQ
jgi:hypothetical protein